MLYEIDQEYALQCAPVLVFLLSQNDLPEGFDRTSAFDVLVKLSQETAQYALPGVIAFFLMQQANQSPEEAIKASLVRSGMNTSLFSEEALPLLYQS